MRRLNCILGRHDRPVTVFGMVEKSDDRGERTVAGWRCACGSLVFRQFTPFRKGAGAKRAAKREVTRGR